MTIYPLVNAAFIVTIGGQEYSFTKVKNISEEIEVETIQEGGYNWYVHNLPKPASSSHKLILEQGLVPFSGTDSLLRAGSRVYNVTIMVMGPDGKTAKTYFFDQGIVTRWEISDLDALQGQVLYNTVEILHTGLREK